jgi:hypothetical protein
MEDFTALDEYPDQQARSRWHTPLTWSALAALGLLVYELTAQPALGVSVLCLKFGWNDWRTALWLR